MHATSQDGAILSALLEALPEAVVLVDDDNRVAIANRASRQVLPALRVGEPLELALRTPDVLDAVRRVGASGKATNVAWRERVPVERLFEVHVAPLRVPASGTEAVVITWRDLTEARSVERMRADFVANASHELRTPLATLLGFVETLQGPAREDASARDRFLAIMREQAQRMARLLDDLLSLSRIEQNAHVKPEGPVDLVLVVRHMTETLSSLARENDVTLVVTAPKPVIVNGDRDEIVRVAENLIENAIKYGAPTEAAGMALVEVSVAANEREGLLQVRDYGPGIAAEHIPRLTERFYRVDAGQSRAKGGTGLGLAIVKHIVAHHRGRLAIDSLLGKGATFTVALRYTHPPMNNFLNENSELFPSAHTPDGLGASPTRSAFAAAAKVLEVVTHIGVAGGARLALGRRLGETMGVTFVIGNAHGGGASVPPRPDDL